MATVMEKLGGADRGGDGNIGGGGKEKKVTIENEYFTNLRARLAEKGIDPKADAARKRAGGTAPVVPTAGPIAPAVVIPRAPMPAPVYAPATAEGNKDVHPADPAHRVVLYDDNGHPIK